MVTGIQDEIRYCSRWTSWGKQEKARSTSQSQFRTENTHATIEADQIVLALQQLATNSNSADFKNNVNRISKLPKSFTTTMSTFDEKSEKFELFEDLFQRSLKIYNKLTEENKINYIHSFISSDALQTFKNITNHNREILGEILAVFCRKYSGPPAINRVNNEVDQHFGSPNLIQDKQKMPRNNFLCNAETQR